MKRTKTLLIIILVGFVIGIAVAMYMWNKPHEKAENKEGISITAQALCEQYSRNEDSAKKLYNGKVLEVSGVVTELSKNQDGYLVATLAGADDMLTVRGTMREMNVKLDSGKTVVLKGFCSDKTMFDVLLTDCVIKE